MKCLQSKKFTILSFYRTVGPMEQEDFMDDLAAVIANTIRKDSRHPQEIQHNHIHPLFLTKNSIFGGHKFLIQLYMDYLVIL
jgi:hypothetical protein